MKYFFNSVRTRSFWRYALFSGEAFGKLLATIGALYLFMEIMDFLSIYTRDRYSRFAIIPIILFAIAYVVITRRPVSRVSFKPSGKDYRIEVKIADLFAEQADLVISSSTTFDTAMANGLIAAESLQGQFATRVFGGDIQEIDRQLDAELRDVRSRNRATAPGKKREYPIGTVARVRLPGRLFYFVAMSRLSDDGTAKSTVREVEEALEKLWTFVAERGELRDVAIPLMGTGRGRLAIPRKKMVERIAQSFADAAREKVFAGKLTIVIRPEDAENFGVNLFEVRDYLLRSLHV